MTEAGAFDSDFVGPRHRLREDLLLRLFLSGEPGRTVLNAGAGQGSFTRLLEERGFAVTSTDVSSDALALLRTRAAGPVVDAPLELLPFADDSFDAAVLGEVLEHIEDHEQALREVGRVVRSDGPVAISVPANPRYFGPSDRWAGHVRRYTRAELVDVVGGAGLLVERVRPWCFPASSLYHRRLYDRRMARVGAVEPGAGAGPLLVVLRALLSLDRLFVGVERGALGYLLLARVF